MFLQGLGRSWGASWDLWCDYLIFLQKLGGRWAQDGRSWRQVAHKMGHDSAKLGQDGAKMSSFSSTWEVLGAFLNDLGTLVG